MNEEKIKEEEFSSISVKKTTYERFYIVKKRIEEVINKGQRIDNDKAINFLLDNSEDLLKNKGVEK